MHVWRNFGRALLVSAFAVLVIVEMAMNGENDPWWWEILAGALALWALECCNDFLNSLDERWRMKNRRDDA